MEKDHLEYLAQPYFYSFDVLNRKNQKVSTGNFLNLLLERESIAVIAYSFDKMHNYLGFFGLQKMNVRNKLSTEIFFEKIRKLGRKVRENKIKTLISYLFFDGGGDDFYKRQLLTLQNVFNDIVLKPIPKREIMLIDYSSLPYEEFLLSYDPITRDIFLFGIEEGNLEAILNIEGKKFIKA